jgi:hypothetical protein
LLSFAAIIVDEGVSSLIGALGVNVSEKQLRGE